jgi:hypothetical protein
MVDEYLQREKICSAPKESVRNKGGNLALPVLLFLPLSTEWYLE